MKNILFVDDEPMFLDSIKRRLRNERGDWKLFFAGTVDEALALIRNHPFDTIVSDVKMPGKDGFALLGALQSRKETRNIPLVMLTGTQDHELKLKALRMGASDLLNKLAATA